MKPVSVVIDREYGSGGREVARILSEKLGIEFYDGNLLMLAAKQYGIDLDTMREYDEKGVGGRLQDIGLLNGFSQGAGNEAPLEVFTALTRLISQLVANGPCIFLGRCAAQILKMEAHVPFIHAFIYAGNLQDRITRAREVDGIDTARIEACIRKKDQQRKNYNRFFTDKIWGEPRNYDLMLNTSQLGYEACAEAILAVMAARNA